METQKPLLKDEDGEEVDVHLYRSMIGSLMYLTSSRPDIMFVVCACARYQVNPKVSHLHVMKRIFRLISWQCKKQTVDANSTTEAEYRSSTRRDLQLEDAEGVDCLPNATIYEQLTLMGYEKLSQKLSFYKAFFSQQWKFLIHTILQCLSGKTTAWNEFSSTMASAIICLAINQKFNFSKYIFESMVKNLENVSGKIFDTQKPRKPNRKNTEVPQPSGSTEHEADEAVNKEMDDSLVRAATTASSLEVE
ncbi:hypothetical protein Tco_0643554 [Tanacetum coccineum]